MKFADKNIRNVIINMFKLYKDLKENINIIVK